MNNHYNVGLVGLGLMGSSIATCLLAAGHRVVGVVKSTNEVPDALGRIRTFLGDLLREGKLPEGIEEAVDRIAISDDFTTLSGVSLVIESISENLESKREVYLQLERYIGPNVPIGSNTSAIPVTLLQQGLTYPARLCGIHWAEPAHITRFMEVVCGDQTDQAVAEDICALAKRWGKEPSLLRKDIRGFITNRIMYAMIREACYLVEQGYATVQDVDRSLRNDLGSWITFAGPFRFMDLTGVPAYATVMRDLLPELCNSTELPAIMQEQVDRGALGVRNAKGFYSYTDASAHRWESLFNEFSFKIRKLADAYPEHVGDQNYTAHE